MKKVFLFLLLAILLLVGWLLFKTFTFTSAQMQVEPIATAATPDGAVDRMVKAISIRTVSFEDPADFDSTQFEMFNTFLAESYPLVHAEMEHKIFSTYSHLYKWTGTDPSLKPIILLAHLDVVPIASHLKWSVHPFTEGVKNDTIYGRGAIDDKCALIGMLEATEQLLREGMQPARTFYFSFGHDEEIGGSQGAVLIAKYLESLGVEAEMVLDEGMAVVKDMVPGIAENMAFIGIAEKGSSSIELRVDMEGGHSSAPSKETSIDVLAAAVAQVKNNPMPSRMTDALKGFINQIGPEMDFVPKLAFANAGLLEPLLLKQYEKSSNSGNALIRTTTSPTIFEAGIKENIIPTSARAVINFRIIPGETRQDVMDHVTRVVNDDRVQLEFMGMNFDPSPYSPSEGAAYDIINRSIKEIYPNMITSPNLVIGATDARHFTGLSSNIYRFVPFKITPDNATCFHGIDERVPVVEFENAIRFYRQLIINGGKN